MLIIIINLSLISIVLPKSQYHRRLRNHHHHHDDNDYDNDDEAVDVAEVAAAKRRRWQKEDYACLSVCLSVCLSASGYFNLNFRLGTESLLSAMSIHMSALCRSLYVGVFKCPLVQRINPTWMLVIHQPRWKHAFLMSVSMHVFLCLHACLCMAGCLRLRSSLNRRFMKTGLFTFAFSLFSSGSTFDSQSFCH